MVETGIARYQTVQISTSSPGELLLALFDGLFRFLHLARYGLQNSKRAQASDAISRAHAIISELYVSLDHKQAPDLCRNLEALYDFCLDRVVQANLRSDPEAISDVIRVLTPIREAFQIAVRGQAAASASEPGQALKR